MEILCVHLFYTSLYIYFSYRLYTTSKKECTKICYLVHYSTNSIAFACFLKGKNPINFYLSVCACLHWEFRMSPWKLCMITCESICPKEHVSQDHLLVKPDVDQLLWVLYLVYFFGKHEYGCVCPCLCSTRKTWHFWWRTASQLRMLRGYFLLCFHTLVLIAA